MQSIKPKPENAGSGAAFTAQSAADEEVGTDSIEPPSIDDPALPPAREPTPTGDEEDEDHQREIPADISLAESGKTSGFFTIYTGLQSMRVV